MKPSKITLILACGFVLSSCAIPLREDLENFVSTFSIEECFKEYKEAKYISTTKTEIENKVTKQVDEFYFNVKDINNMNYSITNKTYENEEQVTFKYENCHKENDKYIRDSDGEKKECTDVEVSEKISTFFYKEVAHDVYHSGGMYYGDFVLDGIRKAQNFYSIENKPGSDVQLLKYSFEERDSEGIYSKITFYVNKIGMLESYSFTGNNGVKIISQEIAVENIK